MTDTLGMGTIARLFEYVVLWGALPMWMAAGLADWACHRALRIEASSGLKESLLHLAMMAQVGLGILSGLAFDPTALLFSVLGLCCIAHEVTTWWDLAYANATRRVPAYEQWVHGIQQCLPWAALTALALAHPDQALATLGLGTAQPVWQLRWRDPPLPPWGWVAVLGGSALCVVLPLLNETWRTLRASRHSAR
jgi:hypothetical protein